MTSDMGPLVAVCMNGDPVHTFQLGQAPDSGCLICPFTGKGLYQSGTCVHTGQCVLVSF